MSEEKKPRRLKPTVADARAALVLVPEPPPPVTAKEFRASLASVWLSIRSEYITSPSNPTVEDLSRKWVKHVGTEAIRKRATEEGWVDAREAWWASAELKLLEKIQDEYLKERVHEMKILRRAFDSLSEIALPLADKDGRVKRDPETGLPMFALPFRSQDKVINALLLVQERSMLLRGEAIMRTESAIKDRSAADGRSEEEDPTFAALAGRVNFSPVELRTLAKQFLVKREAALASLDAEEKEVEADGEI